MEIGSVLGPYFYHNGSVWIFGNPAVVIVIEKTVHEAIKASVVAEEAATTIGS